MLFKSNDKKSSQWNKGDYRTPKRHYIDLQSTHVGIANNLSTKQEAIVYMNTASREGGRRVTHIKSDVYKEVKAGQAGNKGTSPGPSLSYILCTRVQPG